MISIICCYTNTEYLKCLKDSLKDKSNIDWVDIDNRQNLYKSAASALNKGANQAIGEVLIFLHQDVEFLDYNTLDDIEKKALEGYIVGVAGKRRPYEKVLSTMYEGIERKKTKKIIQYPTYVQTCDECLIAMTKEVYEKIGGFDENLFDGWHFYGVDLCLAASLINIKSIVIPSNFWHKSKGNRDKNWYIYQEKLRVKYKGKKCLLVYPCGWIVSNEILYKILNILRKLKHLKGAVSCTK